MIEKLNLKHIVPFIKHALPEAICYNTCKLFGFNYEFYSYEIFREVFINQAYYPLYSSLKPHTTLIDLRAYVGETACYFAGSPNVDTVLAYELVPRTYEEARRNILRSPYKDKIFLFNEGIAKKGDMLRISESWIGSQRTRTSSIPFSRNGKWVELTTLAKILKGKRNVAIKSDIEGAEMYMLKGADLKNVYAIMMEYHNGSEKIIKRLEHEGFKIEKLTGNEQGLLFAKRR